MANEGVDLNPRKLKYLYLVCTVVVFAFMLYLYLPYNGRVVKNLQHARMSDDNDSSLNNKSLKLATLCMQVKNGTVLDLGINETAQFKAILMEPIILNYPRNIYITVKTTHKNYANRLPPLMLTWLQTVDKNKVRCCCVHYAIVKTLYVIICSEYMCCSILETSPGCYYCVLLV